MPIESKIHIFAPPCNIFYISNRFYENQPNEIFSGLSEKASKGKFLKPKKLQNHSNEEKGKEKKKERGKGKDEKKKEAMVALLVFIIVTLEIVFGRKNFSTQKVHLPITLSKIRLDVYYIFNNFCYLFIIFILLIFFQLPNYLICLNRFSLLAHLVFYITFVSNFQLLLVVYNIWIVTTFRFFIKPLKKQEREVQRLPQSWFNTTCIVFYNNISAGIPAFLRFTDVTELM